MTLVLPKAEKARPRKINESLYLPAAGGPLPVALPWLGECARLASVEGPRRQRFRLWPELSARAAPAQALGVGVSQKNPPGGRG
jgi:hypothetical protein